MKKSSLGRRSSLLSGQGRLSNVDRSALRNIVEGKKSFIPKPCFASKNERSSSCDREYMGSSVKKDSHAHNSGLRRSRSFHDLNRNSTPYQTPTQFHRRNTAGSYSTRKFSEGGRASSVGGSKSVRKESRPITEKSFQVGAQQKIQNFFLKCCPDLLDKGSIKPMTATMFADLVNYLIQPFERRVIVTRTNLVEEVLNICKLFNYKGKAEKSWLITVNAPHSWPYVVSFLLWLVEFREAFNAFDVFEALYPDRVEGDADIEEEIDFKLLVPHLIEGYKLADDAKEKEQFLIKYKEALGINEDELEQRQREYNDLQKELNDMSVEDAVEEEKLEALRIDIESLRNDNKNTKDYIYGSENYMANMKEKRKDKAAQFEEYARITESLQEEIRQKRIIVSSQEMSPEDKQKIEDEIATLRREIRQYDDEIKDYEDEIFKVEIELAKARSELNKLVQDYNKEITVNLVGLPALKDLQIADSKIIHMDAPRLEIVDFKIKELKTSSQNRIRDLEMQFPTANINLQKIEDQKTQLAEEIEKLLDQLEHVENEIKETKAITVKEKEKGYALLNDMKQKIKIEKENLELMKNNPEEELTSITQQFSERKEAIDQYVKNGRAILDEKKKRTYQFQKQLEEITRRRFAETKKKLAELRREKQDE